MNVNELVGCWSITATAVSYLSSVEMFSIYFPTVLTIFKIVQLFVTEAHYKIQSFFAIARISVSVAILHAYLAKHSCRHITGSLVSFRTRECGTPLFLQSFVPHFGLLGLTILSLLQSLNCHVKTTISISSIFSAIYQRHRSSFPAILSVRYDS